MMIMKNDGISDNDSSRLYLTSSIETLLSWCTFLNSFKVSFNGRTQVSDHNPLSIPVCCTQGQLMMYTTSCTLGQRKECQPWMQKTNVQKRQGSCGYQVFYSQLSQTWVFLSSCSFNTIVESKSVPSCW